MDIDEQCAFGVAGLYSGTVDPGTGDMNGSFIEDDDYFTGNITVSGAVMSGSGTYTSLGVDHNGQNLSCNIPWTGSGTHQ